MRRHPLDLISLVFGLLFASLAVLGLLEHAYLSVTDLRWLAPAVLVALGLALVLTAARPRSPAAVPVAEPGADERVVDAPADVSEDAGPEDA